MKLQSALVTGAEGFVGRHLCALLREQGFQVFEAHYKAPPGADPAVVHGGDIAVASAADALMDWASETHVVFHLAALASVAACNQNPAECARVNYEGVIHLANAMMDHAPHARLVFASSAEVYGLPQFLPLTEEHPLAPANPYAIAKAAADQHCAWLARAGMLDTVRLRPFNHSGSGQTDIYALPSFARQIAEIEAGKRQPCLRVGNLSARRDMLHVRDVVRAYVLAAQLGETGAVYNVCSGEANSLESLLEQMRGLSTVPFQVEVDTDRIRPVDIPELRGDFSRLYGATGWSPQIGIDVLLQELLDDWRGKI